MLRRALLLCGLLLQAGLAGAGTLALDTSSFSVTLDVQCPEGHVVCERVRYTAVRKRDGERTTLQGRTLHAPCGDRATPCRFLGWQFRQGDTTWFVSEQGELVKEEAGRVLLREPGRWAQ